MSPIRCLLFDLDGTLLDSRDCVVDAVYATAEAHAPGSFTREAIQLRFGESLDEFIKAMEKFVGEKYTKEQIVQFYFDRLNLYHDRTVCLFPGVYEGIHALKEAGYRLGIVTNKQRDFTLRGLRIAGILPLFDSIVTVDDVQSGKPAAEPVLRAMAELRAAAEETVMIGDSKYDILAAKASGVKSVLLDWYEAVHDVTICPDQYFLNFDDFVSELMLQHTK